MLYACVYFSFDPPPGSGDADEGEYDEDKQNARPATASGDQG
jgi:hypothetical protein